MPYDPTTLTPETAATLSGRELEIAIDWLVLNKGDYRASGHRTRPTPLDNDRLDELLDFIGDCDIDCSSGQIGVYIDHLTCLANGTSLKEAVGRAAVVKAIKGKQRA